MISKTIELVYCPHAAGEVAAVYIESRCVDQWVREICRWGVPMRDLVGFPVWGEGLLVPLTSGRPTTLSPFARPYACRVGRLYLPTNGALVPAVGEDEICDAIASAVALFHPVHGWIEFDRSEGIPFENLLATPVRRPASWDCAHPGHALHSRIHSIGLLHPPAPEEIMENLQDDIGHSPLRDVPTAPDEPARHLGARMIRGTKKALARGIFWLTERVPDTATEPTWVNRVQDWAASQSREIMRVDQGARDREIHRLLQLLETDPDRGLQFALPLSGLPAGRGHATPANRLTQRLVNFGLSDLQGGSPVDGWSVQWEQQQALQQQYRALADRELKLQRYRRAAYIFARLLGDVDAAGNVLEQGGHFQEAAVLYRDRLHDPERAVHCLVRGGLFTEAIHALEELGHWEQAGDLCRRIEREDDARRYFEHAVKELEDGDEPYRCMRILVEKLDDLERGGAVSRKVWPLGRDAVQCVEYHFRMLGERGLNEEAERLLSEVSQVPPTPHHVEPVAKILAGLGQAYPSAHIRALAQDRARWLIGRRLAHAERPEASTLLGHLRTVAPHDRLLRRDTARFLKSLPTPSGPRVVPVSPGSVRQMRPVREMSFFSGAKTTWHRFGWHHGCLYAAGCNGKDVVLARVNPREDPIQLLRWPSVGQDAGDLVLAVDRSSTPAPTLLMCQNIDTPIRQFPPDPRIRRADRAGRPPWCPDAVVGAAYDGVGRLWVLTAKSNALALECYSRRGRLEATHDVTRLFSSVLEDSSTEFSRMRMVVSGRKTFVLWGQCLYEIDRDVGWVEHRLPSPGWELFTSSRHTTPRVFATLDEGIYVVSQRSSSSQGVHVAPELSRPQAALTSRGHLIALNDQRGCAFKFQHGAVQFLGALQFELKRPLAMAPASPGNQFAVLSWPGKISLFNLG